MEPIYKVNLEANNRRLEKFDIIKGLIPNSNLLDDDDPYELATETEHLFKELSRLWNVPQTIHEFMELEDGTWKVYLYWNEEEADKYGRYVESDLTDKYQFQVITHTWAKLGRKVIESNGRIIYDYFPNHPDIKTAFDTNQCFIELSEEEGLGYDTSNPICILRDDGSMETPMQY